MTTRQAPRGGGWKGGQGQGGSGKGGSGKGSRGRRSSGGDVGNALRAAYHDTLNEDIPPDLLALLGKLD